MFRTNLATRPFYNERAAHVVIGLAAAIVLAITALNVVRIVSLSRRNTELSARSNADHTEAERLTAEAAQIRKTINKDELALVVGAAEEANALIDPRTFSWTKFFNQIESTLPPDVMLTSVRPSFKDGVTNVAMSVLARRAGDLEDFMDKLEATGSDLSFDRRLRALESIYVRPDRAEGAPDEPTPPAAPARGTPPAAAPSGSTPRPAPPPRGGGRQ